MPISEQIELKTTPTLICVLGLGNLMRTDDAIGMLTLQLLAADSRFPRGIQMIEGGTLGLDLLHALHGVSHLLVLDAVDTGSPAGTFVRFTGEAFNDLPASKSVHLLGLTDLLSALKLMNAPRMEVVLLGVQPASTDWGTVLTPTVQAAQPELVEASIRQLMEWAAN